MIDAKLIHESNEYNPISTTLLGISTDDFPAGQHTTDVIFLSYNIPSIET
jgi:hypothetical protein